MHYGDFRDIILDRSEYISFPIYINISHCRILPDNTHQFLMRKSFRKKIAIVPKEYGEEIQKYVDDHRGQTRPCNCGNPDCNNYIPYDIEHWYIDIGQYYPDTHLIYVHDILLSDNCLS